MKIYEDAGKEKEKVEKCIEKFGYTPDHNFYWMIYCSDEGIPGVAVWENDYAIWFYRDTDKNELRILSNPISPISIQEEILKEFIDYMFNQFNSVVLLDVRDDILNFARKNYSKSYRPDYDLTWPVVDMANFDPVLSGGRFKELRNALNKFNREHKSEIVPIALLSKKDLHEIVNRWSGNRVKANIEQVAPDRYHNMIDGDFLGTDSARVMVVDGRPVGFNAGWITPNKPEEWSGAIGIHDYSVKDLGVALMYEDLVWIKNAGYKSCDLEGSESESLKFKFQFLSEYKSYKTYTFYIK